VIECALYILFNVALATFYFSAAQQVYRSSVAEEGSFDGSDVVSWVATAVPYLLCSAALNFVFAIWVIYSAVRWKVYSRLVLLASILILWLGVLESLRK